MIVQNDFVNDSRIIKEANTLGEYGFEVMVLALHNKGLEENQRFEHFCVKRLKLSTRDKLGKNKFSQIIKYIEFRSQCVNEAMKFLPDVVHCHDIYTLPIGEMVIKKLGKHIKLVYDSHELWSQASNNLSMPKILIKIQNKLESRIIKKCHKVITVSESIVKYLKKEYKLQEQPILIRNIPPKWNIAEKRKVFHEEFNIDLSKKIVLYQGVIGEGRGIEKLIESMNYINKNNIILVFMGNGNKIDHYKNLTKELGVSDKVYFHKAVDPSILKMYTSSADLGVSMIKNICLSYYYSLPNKMFEYIQAEIPVICSNYPDMEGIVREYKVGETADPNSSEEIARSIEKVLLDDQIYNKYKNNCKTAKKQLNWECESEKLIQLYRQLI